MTVTLEISAVGLEREIIGLALVSPTGLANMGHLRADHFLQPQARAVWQLIQNMSAAGQIVTLQSVAQNLHTLPKDASRGVDKIWLFDCQAAAPIEAAAETYANQLIDKTNRYNLRQALLRCQQIASGEGTAAELTELVRAEIDGTTPDASSGQWLQDTLAQTISGFDEATPTVPTPWPSLNRIIGGWRPGALYVIGARPGAGKTIMGLQAALHMARQGPVAFNSLEMGVREIHQRAVAHVSGVGLGYLQGTVNGRPTLVGENWERVQQARPVLEALPLSIDDRSYVTTTDIRAHARTVSRRGELQGVVVDYLQLMGTPSGDRRPRHEVVASMSRDLKLLAKELHCPVLALSQLNRASENRVGKAPTLADLRESGAIEQDADVVLLLSVPEDDDGKPRDDQLRVLVAKNRHGEANRGVVLHRQGWLSTLQEPRKTNPNQGVF